MPSHCREDQVSVWHCHPQFSHRMSQRPLGYLLGGTWGRSTACRSKPLLESLQRLPGTLSLDASRISCARSSGPILVRTRLPATLQRGAACSSKKRAPPPLAIEAMPLSPGPVVLQAGTVWFVPRVQDGFNLLHLTTNRRAWVHRQSQLACCTGIQIPPCCARSSKDHAGYAYGRWSDWKKLMTCSPAKM